MKKLLFVLLCFMTFSVNAFDMLGGGSSIPAAARAAGYTLHTFSINSNFSTANVDQGITYASGYKMYYNNFFGPAPTVPETINTDGSMTLSGSNGNLVSTGYIATSPYFVGTAFGGGGYFEAEIRFDPTTANAGSSWPAFWMMSLEHNDRHDIQWTGEATGYMHFMEVDIMEWYQSARGQYQSTLHDWYGIYGTTCAAWCNISSGFTPGIAKVPRGTDWTLYHRYAVAWIPATSTTSGRYDFYFDDIKMTSFSYSQFTTQAAPPTSSTTWTYGIGDSQHLTLEMGHEDVKSVNVWQATTANNITN
jgi:hypothetical protein